MTPAELTAFEAVNPHITVIDHENEGCIGFRNERLPWFRNNPTRQRLFDCDWLFEHTTDELLAAINRGLEVENITRVTGYMTKTSQWNKGKLGELKERAKWSIGPCQAECPMAAVG